MKENIICQVFPNWNAELKGVELALKCIELYDQTIAAMGIFPVEYASLSICSSQITYNTLNENGNDNLSEHY